MDVRGRQNIDVVYSLQVERFWIQSDICLSLLSAVGFYTAVRYEQILLISTMFIRLKLFC